MGWRGWRRLGMSAAFVIGAAAAAPSCTTYIHPTTCARGETACAGIHDARFCDYVAVSVEGADCASFGVAPSKHFCVATTKCLGTSYAVKDSDCRVLRSESVRDGARDECAPDTPMFTTR
jgi:hypothetical protein